MAFFSTLGQFLSTDSIRRRFLFGCFILLPLFLSLLGVVLDNIHQQSLIRTAHASLQLHLHTLIAEAEPELTDMSVNGQRLVQVRMPEQLIDPDLNSTVSDLQGFIFGVPDQLLWQSRSAAINTLTKHLTPSTSEPGEIIYSVIEPNPAPFGFFVASLSTVFEMAAQEVRLTFVIAKSQKNTTLEMRAYRQSLALALSLIGFILAGSLLLIVTWGLRPLTQLAEDITRLERGAIDHMASDYPTELHKVTHNLNQLIISEANQRERYRNTLSDLAHSLKTPLAVSQGLLSELPDTDTAGRELEEQITRMNQIIQYQLQRATSVQPTLGKQQTPLKAVVDRLVSAMQKVYYEKHMSADIQLDETIHAPMETRDLTEILGNLVDNAFKYGDRQVRITHTSHDEHWRLDIENDGRPVPGHLKAEILKRGARADTALSGQGIGLAVVTDIVSSYGGAIEVTDSALGGAKVSVTLPQ